MQSTARQGLMWHYTKRSSASALNVSYQQGDSTASGSPPAGAGREIDRSVQLSCGEHTDYGLLTLVNQDPDIPALQVAPRSRCTTHPQKLHKAHIQ